MGVALDGHVIDHIDAAGTGDPPEVVSGQVDEHDMFGLFLGVGQELLGESIVLGHRPAPRPGSGQGLDQHFPALHPDHDLGR
jgi:hypothetical protein